MYNTARQLRADLSLDGILDEPYPSWDVLRTHYKKYIHGRTKANELVLIESIGRMNVSALKSAGIGKNDIVRHFCHYLEYIFAHVLKDDSSQVLMVYDMADLSLLKLASPDFISTVKAISDALGNLYPRRISRYVLVNAPSYFENIWNLISPALPQGARDNMIVCKTAEDLDVSTSFVSACIVARTSIAVDKYFHIDSFVFCQRC